MSRVDKAAIIDIGSNSCRMVIYECSGHSILPYFNEKTMAGLGRGLSETGRLSVDGYRLALETMHRFRAILEGLNVENTTAVATAAVREALDGDVFCRDAEAALGIPVRVLSGVEEGQLSAAGVGYGFGADSGLVADMGGTSMELHTLAPTAPRGETFALGPLASVSLRRKSEADQKRAIKKLLGESKLLKTEGPLYLVGGGWRNLALVHMLLHNYPLRVVQAYRLSEDGVKFVRRQLKQATEKPKLRQAIQSVSKKRYDSLAHVALVLDCLMDMSGQQEAVISAYGLREGVIAQGQQLAADQNVLDAVPHQFHLTNQACSFGAALFEFSKPLHAELGQSEQTLERVCLMAEAGTRLHPDHRADLIFEHVLRAPLPQLTHPQRLFAALAVASRNTYKFRVSEELQMLSSSNLMQDARIFGTLMRLASVYSGRSAELLQTARLSLTQEKLILNVLESDVNLISETVHRRLTQLANLVGRKPGILSVTDRDVAPRSTPIIQTV